MKSRFFHKSVALLLLIPLLFPTGLLLSPQKAEAQGIVATQEVPLSPLFLSATAQLKLVPISTAANVKVSIFSAKFWTKEYILDLVISALGKALIRTITMNIINWINNDFNGNPLYNTGTAGLMQGVVDQAVGDIIYNTDFAFLCSPFRLEILAALQFRYASYQKRIQCTLTQVEANIQDFYQGAFRDAQSWDTWFKVTTVPNNNVYGAYIAAETNLRLGIQTKQGFIGAQLLAGSDFFPKSKCHVYYPNPTDQNDPGVRKCQNETPGVLVANQLSTVISSPIRQIELADEIDEGLTAIGSALAVKAITTGLRALSQATSPGQPSYIDQYGAYVDSQALQNIQRNASENANDQIQNEQAFLIAKEDSLRFVANAGNALLALKACYEGKATSTTLTANELATAAVRASNASTTLDREIIPKLAPLVRDVVQASSTIQKARQQLADLQKPTTPTPDPYADLQQQVSNYSLSGITFHTLEDRVLAEQDKEQLSGSMRAIQTDAQTKLTVCRVFPQTSSGSVTATSN